MNVIDLIAQGVGVEPLCQIGQNSNNIYKKVDIKVYASNLVLQRKFGNLRETIFFKWMSKLMQHGWDILIFYNGGQWGKCFLVLRGNFSLQSCKWPLGKIGSKGLNNTFMFILYRMGQTSKTYTSHNAIMYFRQALPAWKMLVSFRVLSHLTRFVNCRCETSLGPWSGSNRRTLVRQKEVVFVSNCGSVRV